MKKTIVFFIAFILSFFCGIKNSLTAQVLEKDSLALVTLYNNTGGPEWTEDTNWLTAEPVDTWFRVNVTNNRVTQLNLQSNNLTGSIPEEIGNLTGLEYLSFYVNSLSGEIPETIGNLINLTSLYISHNNISGQIPESIGNLTKLTQLYLNSNNLSGPIPMSIGDLVNLEYFHLFANSLSETIPGSIGNLIKLKELNFYKNDLNGPLPAGITNMTDLEKLVLFNCSLSGTLPGDIGKLSKLTSISIASNEFNGPIPTSIKDLENLEMLSFGNNNFTDNIPDEIGSLSSLLYMDLSYNAFSGQLPKSIGNLINLNSVYLSANQLTDSLPGSIKNLSNLQYLYIDQNDMDDLPVFPAISTLEDIRIQGNKFTFEDIEPNIGVATNFKYSPQDNVGEGIDSIITKGEDLELFVQIGGSVNQYKWYKDGEEINGADSSHFQIFSATLSDSGTYICHITNTIVTGLIIKSQPMHLKVNPTTGIETDREYIPKIYALYQNYPNPFNPVTIIKYQLPKISKVDLSIYNLLGQKVATLVSSNKPTGIHKIIWDASTFSNGVYFYRLEIDDNGIKTRKLVVLK